MILAAVALPALSTAQAGKSGRGKPPRQAHVQAGVSIFLATDQAAIRDYIAGLPPQGLPPGLAKRDRQLPPGLERQLRKNGRLPPGLQKRIQPCPVELERRLSPLAAGLKRGFVAGRVVIYNQKTFVVLDLFNPF